MNNVFRRILKSLIFIFCLGLVLGFGLALAFFFHGKPELALLLIRIGFISGVIYGLLCEMYKRQKRKTKV